MGLFDFFKKKKADSNEDQKRWDRMWELWTEEQAESPYAELMTYQSEINNGGHDQYFHNIESTGDLPKEMSALQAILTEELKNNLQKAYQAYLMLKENEDDEAATEILEKCDDVFYENEEIINHILEMYAAKIEP